MFRRLWIFVGFTACIYFPLSAVPHKAANPPETAPWFTGPLFAQAATVIPLGHINFEPYFFATNNFANYNNRWKSKPKPDFWSLSSPLPFWIGIAPWADIIIQPTVLWNRTQNASSWGFGDFVAALEFQILQGSSQRGKWMPSIKLSFYETFPTGKYRNSHPSKKLTDLGGFGAYSTEVLLVVGNLEHVYGSHYFHWELNFDYFISTNVHVQGINAYGGGYGTNGHVSPGQIFEVDIGMEYNLTQNWALAMDIIGDWRASTHFHGTPGVTPTGTIAQNSQKASALFSLAPAIEYNFSESLGLIGGVWFTVAGKNTANFYSGSIALNYYR